MSSETVTMSTETNTTENTNAGERENKWNELLTKISEKDLQLLARVWIKTELKFEEAEEMEMALIGQECVLVLGTPSKGRIGTILTKERMIHMKESIETCLQNAEPLHQVMANIPSDKDQK
jgi:hypothetical protein